MKIIGLDKLIKDLRAFGVEGEKRIAETTEATARDIELHAKQIAPFNKLQHGGTLRQNIKAIEQDKLNWKVFANAFGNAPYSAYMEFGTGGLVEVPAELKEMAIQFKGQGIKKVDLRPQPFLWPAFVKGRVDYIDELTRDLNDLTKKI